MIRLHQEKINFLFKNFISGNQTISLEQWNVIFQKMNTFIYLFSFGGCIYSTAFLYRSGNWSSSYIDSGHQIQFIRPGSKYSYVLNLLIYVFGEVGYSCCNSNTIHQNMIIQILQTVAAHLKLLSLTITQFLNILNEQNYKFLQKTYKQRVHFGRLAT